MKQHRLYFLFLLSFLTSLLPRLVLADEATKDPLTLLAQFDAAEDDVLRLSVANDFFQQLQAIGFIDETVHFGVGTPSDSVRQQVCYWAGELLYDGQRYQESVERCLQALPLYHGDAAADCLSLLSLNYVRLGDQPKAIDYAKRCYELDLKSGDNDRISSSLNTLAGIYISANLPQEAEPYVLKGIEACEKAGNQRRLAILNGTAADVYHALDEQEKALEYATRARDIDARLGNADRVAVRQTQMAAALVGLDRLDEARECLKAAIPVLQSSGDYHSLGIACNKMGELSMHAEDPATAARYYLTALQIFQAMGDVYNELHTRLGLYKSLHDSLPDVAQEHFARYNFLKDSLYSSQVAAAMGEQSALLENAELQAETEQHRARARKHYYIGLLVALLLGCIAGWQYWRLRRRTREFELQFNQLTDSLEELSSQQSGDKLVDASMAASTDSDDDTMLPHDREFLNRVKEIVDRQIDEGRIDVAAMAQEMCMSMTSFRRKFTELVKEKPQAYLMRLRMEKAKDLLDKHPELNIQEVGLRCGFEDKSNFTRAFKNRYGVTPSEYTKT